MLAQRASKPNPRDLDLRVPPGRVVLLSRGISSFVRPDARGAGIGAALIERLLVLGSENGWSRVYWMTQGSNAVARRLSDRYTARDDLVRYTIVLGDRAEKPDARGV